jgi:putative metalloprotease
MKKLLLGVTLIFLIDSYCSADEVKEEGSYWEHLRNKVSLEKIEKSLSEGVATVKENVSLEIIEEKMKAGLDTVKEKIADIDEKKVDNTIYDASKLIDIDKRENQVVSAIETHLPDWEIVRSGTMQIRAGSDLVRATMISDKEMKLMADYSITELDRNNTLLDSNSRYNIRLEKLKNSIVMPNELKVDIKAYQNKKINAFALTNGSIRVYTGLMDIMNDDELLFVIAHELGHIKHKHSKDSYRLAYLVSGLRKGTVAQGGLTGVLAEGVIGKLSSDLINSKFSRDEEREADQYGLEVLKRNSLSAKVAISSLNKLQKSSSSLLSSHPSTEDRITELKR